MSRSMPAISVSYVCVSEIRVMTGFNLKKDVFSAQVQRSAAATSSACSNGVVRGGALLTGSSRMKQRPVCQLGASSTGEENQ